MKVRVPISIKESLIRETLGELKRAGQNEGREAIILWFGKRTTQGLEITEVFNPIQEAGEDFFRIPEEGMKAIMTRIRETRGMIVAQVHSHPAEAFHSVADDEWAIIRHEGALSLVVPFFGSRTQIGDFWSHVKTYEFSRRATWDEVNDNTMKTLFEVVHE